MNINQKSLDTVFRMLRKEFRDTYQNGDDADAAAIATTIPLTTSSARFDFMGDEPEMREWIGGRVVQQFRSFNYEVYTKDWELTIGVNRNDFLDDNIGLYKIKAAKGGHGARMLYPREAYKALENGITGLCYDGQPFFDTAHPVGEDDDIDSVANYLNVGGASAASPWYVMDTSRSVKPILLVDRERPVFSAFADYSNLHTFHTKEFLFGCQARLGTGYGMWQTCFRNEGELNVDNLYATMFAMENQTMDRKNEYGRRQKLAISPNLLVVGPTNRRKAIACLQSSIVQDTSDALAVSNSTTQNPMFGQLQLKVVNWLP